MRIRNLLIVSVLLLLLPLGFSRAQQGSSELSLDRLAVADLLSKALPSTIAVDAPGLGTVTLQVRPPRRVDFHDGGIEFRVLVSLARPEWETQVFVRLMPSVDPADGTIALAPVEVRPETQLPVEPNLARWVDALRLPRRIDWSLPVAKDRTVGVRCFVQGVTVGEDRLVVQLGVSLD